MKVGPCVMHHRVFGGCHAITLPDDEITMCTRLYRMTTAPITGKLWRELRGLPSEQQIALRLWDDRPRESN